MSDPIRIYVKSGLSRGKAAAAAVHAALLALDVHPGVPVIVLGGYNKDIERRRTVVRDHGKTEVEPGTMTAGTDYQSEKVFYPVDEAMKKSIERSIHHYQEFQYGGCDHGTYSSSWSNNGQPYAMCELMAARVYQDIVQAANGRTDGEPTEGGDRG